MIAILKIKVPDDFEKGDGFRCPLYVGCCPANIKFGIKGMCKQECCPLEITDKE